MKIIQISDIHLTIPGERMGGLNPHDRLVRALAHVNQHHSDAQRIIITGDLTHWGETPAYESLSDALVSQMIPVRLMIGNHDNRETFLSVFSDHPRDEHGYINYAETLEDVRFIYLDTTAPGTHAGHFCADRLAWLEAELQNAVRARLFLHHHPMELGLPAIDLIALMPDDRAPFKAMLEKFQNRIDYIHFGHVHTSIHGMCCGIPFASVPSTGNQCIPDLEETKWLYGAPLDPAYYVIQIANRDTTIHQIPYAWDGPVFSSGTEWKDWAKSG